MKKKPKKPPKTYDEMLDELRQEFPCEPDWVLEQVLAKHGWEKPLESGEARENIRQVLA